ncbi:hypothetical protein MIND_00575300 [Mycena indigotica]|uniref:Uncharacterized protein n=1 Tax=Mycena indigotica TaxID=2126181 RepID=A0A8H6SR12_9AGAR|nr:uncharacterized protein MIND_00575300 [Mycena indigotica]KAF7303465.1 hypothetical protein MIND_00575300 [Mycena indigotica]
MSVCLPPELERKIFEAAVGDRAKDIPNLMLVAWRVKHWLEPLLYRSLIIYKSGWNTHPSMRSGQFLTIPRPRTEIVRHLLLQESVPRVECERILAKCPNLTALYTVHLLADSTTFASLTRIDCPPAVLELHRSADLLPTRFPRLTHVHLFVPASGPWHVGPVPAASWLALRHLPALTHLAFSTTPGQQACADLLAPDGCPNLQVLLFFSYRSTDDWGPRRQWRQQLRNDPRFFVVDVIRSLEDEHDPQTQMRWLADALEDFCGDIWEQAERKAALRAKGTDVNDFRLSSEPITPP